MKHGLPAPRTLRWKLTLWYVLFTSLVATLLFLLLYLLITTTIELFFVPSLVLYGMQPYPNQLSPFFVHNGRPDQQALTVWIKNSPDPTSYGYQPELRAILDRQGRVVVSSGNKAVPPGTLIQTQLSTQATTNLQQVLADKNNNQGMVNKNADNAIIAIVPIRGENHRVYGAMIENTGPNIYSQETIYWLKQGTLYSLSYAVAYTLFAFIIGMISSVFIARTITRRFNKLAIAADNWSQGNFSMFVQDTSPDELGQLSHKLNRMAEQLQNLFQTRRQLAILEERNRLARDLHDSVKQHIFVIALQVGTAKLRLEHGQNVVEAQQRLSEAEQVLHQVQEELKTMIRELRPVALEGKGLTPALQELIEQWRRQHSIRASLQVDGEYILPLLIEEALFRVAQETLSNVARHSHATTVEMQLVKESDRVILSVVDNGQGFDATTTERKGVGLLSMRERMQALGGDVDIESQIGKGTRVVAHCIKQLSEV